MIQPLDRVRRNIRLHGISETAKIYYRSALRFGVLRSPIRRLLPASLADATAIGRVCSSADSVLELVWGEFDHNAINEELDGLDRELAVRLRGLPEALYPQDWGLGPEARRLLYYLLRMRRPQVAIETGVANGVSTFYLIRALDQNGLGSLHSIDLSLNTASVLRDGDKASWNLHLLDKASLKESFRSTLARIPGPVDFFLHDSDHSYSWQSRELREVWSRLSPSALIVFRRKPIS